MMLIKLTSAVLAQFIVGYQTAEGELGCRFKSWLNHKPGSLNNWYYQTGCAQHLVAVQMIMPLGVGLVSFTFMSTRRGRSITLFATSREMSFPVFVVWPLLPPSEIYS